MSVQICNEKLFCLLLPRRLAMVNLLRMARYNNYARNFNIKKINRTFIINVPDIKSFEKGLRKLTSDKKSNLTVKDQLKYFEYNSIVFSFDFQLLFYCEKLDFQYSLWVRALIRNSVHSEKKWTNFWRV